MGVFRFIKEFVADRGFTLMLFGISVATVGAVLYMVLNTPRYAALRYPQAAFGVAVFGIAVYFVGRVSVAVQRNKTKRKAMSLLSRHDDESGAQ